MTETKSYLPAGKLPAPLLARLLTGLPTEDAQLVLGPAVGEDAAVVDFVPGSGTLLVAKSDPITFAADEIGHYAVNVCVNDLAVTGATPRFYMPTLLLPAGQCDEILVETIFGQIGVACRSLEIVVIGGHTEITHSVTQPVVAGTMLGEVATERVVRTGGCRTGDVVLMAGSAPVEGASIIAREMRSVLLERGWSSDRIDAAAAYLHDPGISVYRPAQAASATGWVTAMHDPTEGGIATGLREMASAAGVGLEIDLAAIPIPQLAHDLCAEFDLDPLGVIASGALLTTAHPDHAENLLEAWQASGWAGAILGRVTEQDAGLIAQRAGRSIPFPQFLVDEITRLWN